MKVTTFAIEIFCASTISNTSHLYFSGSSSIFLLIPFAAAPLCLVSVHLPICSLHCILNKELFLLVLKLKMQLIITSFVFTISNSVDYKHFTRFINNLRSTFCKANSIKNAVFIRGVVLFEFN